MRVLITGGAGFIGVNAADSLLRAGEEIVVLDNLSRAGSDCNLAWLREQHGEVPFERADVRDFDAVQSTFAKYEPLDVVLHQAAQVAVTVSVQDPLMDFEVNAQGTLNVLEAARRSKRPPIFLYSSTNKVYGAMEGIRVVEEPTRYRYADYPHGLPEIAALDFHSPYGCSKGAADQYVRDYHRIYGMPTIVFRNSCIYGPRQFGIEDQGWLAWFMIATVLGKPITIYGDGKQVRDVLYIDDLIAAMSLAVEQVERTSGRIYNIGGGPQSSLSVWAEFGPILEDHLGRPIEVRWGDWRPGDQKVYVSDIRKAAKDFGWSPETDPQHGIERLFDWVAGHAELFTTADMG